MCLPDGPGFSHKVGGIPEGGMGLFDGGRGSVDVTVLECNDDAIVGESLRQIQWTAEAANLVGLLHARKTSLCSRGYLYFAPARHSQSFKFWWGVGDHPAVHTLRCRRIFSHMEYQILKTFP